MSNAVIDLFCGIGGLTKGLELSGLNVVAGIDIDKSCRFAYEHNNRAKFIYGDVGSIDTELLKRYYPKNSIKILVGCAPCQCLFQNILKDIEKEEEMMINGSCYILFLN